MRREPAVYSASSEERKIAMLERQTTFGSKAFQNTYLLGTVIVWTGIWIATAVILAGTAYFAQMLPILVGGGVWFLVILPGAFFWTQQKKSNSK
jgi:hypothetical protein